MAEKDPGGFPENTDKLEKNFNFRDSFEWLSDAENLIRQGKAVESSFVDENGDYIYAIRELNKDGSPGKFLVWANMKKFVELSPNRAKREALGESVENTVIDKKWSKEYGDYIATKEIYGTDWTLQPEGKQSPIEAEEVKRALRKRGGN